MSLTATRDGHPVAEIRPLSRRPVSVAALLDRWRYLPRVDPERLAADLDAAVDPSL